MEETWFMASMEYNPNGKDITAPKEYVLMWFIAPMEKAWCYEDCLKKIQHKRYNTNQN